MGLSFTVKAEKADYSWSSVSAVSTPEDSTNCRWKILGKKIPEISKKQNLNLLSAGNYLHSIYIICIAIYIAFTLY